MTSVHGSKGLVTAVIFCMTIGMLFGALLSKKRNEILLYEKKLHAAEKSLEERNENAISGISFKETGDEK